METIADKQTLYQLMVSQLKHDGYQAMAEQLQKAALSFPPSPQTPPDRLLEIVRVGWKMEPTAKGEGGIDLMRGLEMDGPSPFPLGKPPVPIGVQDRRCNFTHRNVVKALRFSPDGKYLATGSADGLCQLALSRHIRATKSDHSLDEAADMVLRSFADHTQAVNDVVFHPTSPLVFTASRDCNVRCFEYTHPDQQLALQTYPDNFGVRTLDCHPAGTQLVACTDDFTVRFWDIDTARCFSAASVNAEFHAAPINMVRYSIDGKLFATGGMDGAVKIWDSNSGRCINTIPSPHGGAEVNSLQFSKTGKYLLTAGRDAYTRLWDLSSGRNLKQYGVPTGIVALKNPNIVPRNWATFTFTENSIAFMDETSCQCVVVDARSGTETQKLGGHTSTLRCVVSSPTEQILVTSCDDKAVRAWAPPPL